LIKSEKIRKFVEKALEMAPKEFWIAPCSSSGKYYPPEDQVKGGTIIHSRKTIQVALSLFNFFDITDQLTKDQIIAACILHDIQKTASLGMTKQIMNIDQLPRNQRQPYILIQKPTIN